MNKQNIKLTKTNPEEIRDINKDANCVRNFIMKENPDCITAQEFQSLASIQLEIYQQIIKLTKTKF